MATEDLTTYTKTDPLSRLTVTSSKVTWVGVRRNEDTYLYKDKGANHFDGDLEHLLDFRYEGAGYWSLTNCWALCNLINDFDDIDAAGGDGLAVVQREESSGVHKLFLKELDGGTQYDDVYTASEPVTYYLKVKRDEAVGTYGTLYLYIYSDAERTNLLDTLSIALHSSKKDFRYIYACQSWDTDSSDANNWNDGWTENLDLQEEAAVVTRSFGFITG